MSIVKRLRVPLFSCMFAAVPAAVFFPVAGAQAAAWSVVPSPDPAGGSELNGVASVSASDAWAVGDSSSGTLTVHWNGKAWKAVNSPNATGGNNTLTAASAVSSTDVWAVGSAGGTLTEHWNGRQWKVVPSPTPGTLLGVAAVSATDVWAVGSVAASGSGPSQTLIEHWNGTSWSVVPSPNAGTQDNQLNAVTAVTATDVWAVGKFAATSNGVPQTLIEHWDGTSWSVVPSPDASTSFNSLTAAAAVSASDVWAVGKFATAAGGWQTLIEHWNGTSWSVVASPSPGGDDGLTGAAVVSAGDIWAVGSTGTQTLTEHWDGTSWSVVPSPSPGTLGSTLNAAAADQSTGQAWAVGFTSVTNGSVFEKQTLTEVNP
jgi:hypothetical protein